MKRFNETRPSGPIRCENCKGMGCLSTDTPLHRVPCERCRGSGMLNSYMSPAPGEWSVRPLDMWRRHTAGNARHVMRAVALCLKNRSYARAQAPRLRGEQAAKIRVW